MASDRLIDMMWGFLAVFIVWIANQLRKRAKPFIESIKRLTSLSRIVKELEETTVIEKNKLQALQNISRNPIFIIDINGYMVYANQAFIDVTGFKDEKEAHGVGYLRAVHPEDRTEVQNQRILLAHTTSSYNGTIRYKNLETGNVVTYTCVSETYETRDKKIAGTIGTLYL